MSTFPTAFEDDTLIARVEPDTQGPHFRAELTDRQLVNEVLAGSDDAFEQIFDRYKRSVAHVAARYFRRPEQIEEIIQISFAKAFTELTNFRGQHEASLGSWLCRIAANACLDTIRVQKRKPERLDCDLTANETETLLDLASSREQDAEQKLAVRDLSEKLLKNLPEDDRAILQMLYMEDMSVADIAILLGWSRSKVKIRAWRARNSLRKILKHYM